MTDLSSFPIATRWKPKHPDRIQLYSFPTPNGVKVSIALEELGLPYDAHPVDILKNESWTPEFLSLNPNGKIPAIVDPDGPGGKMFGQLGFFNKFAGREIADKRPLNRYADESKRLLGVMETRLAGRKWFMDDEYTIADIAHVGWVRNLIGFYEARDIVGYDGFPGVDAWLKRVLERPAVQRGLTIPAR